MHGDAALVIRSQACGDKTEEDEDPLIVITVDTSYSGTVSVVGGGDGDADEEKGRDDRRGFAVSELLVTFNESEDGFTSAAEVHGLLSNGEPYDCFPDGRDAGIAGRVVDPDGEGWVVKGRRKKDGKLMLSRLCGWDPENRFVESTDPVLDA